MSASPASEVVREGPRVVIACEVMRPELESAHASAPDVEVEYLEQGLHRTPELLEEALRSAIDVASRRAGQIVLGYGLCSNGTANLVARRQELVIPRVHDCISLFLGSREDYDEAFNARSGTYYITPGWVAAGKDPIGVLEDDYIPRVGRETALWALEEELKHYTHVTLINTGIGDVDALRSRARSNADFLNKTYEEVPGSLAFFEKILRGPYDEGDFVRVAPGDAATQDAFL